MLCGGSVRSPCAVVVERGKHDDSPPSPRQYYHRASHVLASLQTATKYVSFYSCVCLRQQLQALLGKAKSDNGNDELGSSEILGLIEVRRTHDVSERTSCPLAHIVSSASFWAEFRLKLRMRPVRASS
eukprot:309239-Pleurochrysis_carterae.AAC.1